MLETCCDLMVEAYERGMMTSRDGNVSLRYADQKYWYLSPTNVRKHTLQPDQFKKLSLELGENQSPVTLPYTDISAQLRPSGEYPVHYLLQKNIPTGWDTRVVMHVHSTYTVAAMHAGIKLEEFREEFPEIARYSRVAPSTWELAHACVEALKLDPDTGETQFDIVGVKGHGVFAVDRTPWRAYEHIERLDHISKIVLISRGISV